MNYYLVFYENNQITKNNLLFKNQNGITIHNSDIFLDEFPMWAIKFNDGIIFDVGNHIGENRIESFVKKIHELCENHNYISPINLIYNPISNSKIDKLLDTFRVNLNDYHFRYPVNIIPYSKNMIIPEPYLSKNGEFWNTMGRIYTHIGCRFNCNFCCDKSTGTRMNINFIQHFNWIKKYLSTNWLYVGNNTYGQDLEESRSIDILRDYNLIVQTRPDIVLMERRYSFFDKKCIKIVEFGVESFDDAVLKSVNKGIASSQIYAAIDLLNRMGKKVVINLMLNTKHHTPFTYSSDYGIISRLIEEKKISYFNITICADYNSLWDYDWDENYVKKSWNVVTDIPIIYQYYKKFINLQTTLVNVHTESSGK